MFQEGAVARRVARSDTAIEYYPLIKVDERDLRLAACRGGEAGVVGEAACV